MATKYTTVQGDTWDLISYKVYGSEKYIGNLMQANFALLDYTVFPSGLIIVVPVLPIEETDDAPEWRTLDE